MSRDRIDVKPDLKAIEKKLRKGLTLRGLVGKIFSPVRKGHNKNKVMMTTEEILKQIESVPRHQITYTRQDGRTNEYTVAITERHADHIIGYKFQNGESCGIRRFNISQIGILRAGHLTGPSLNGIFGGGRQIFYPLP